MKIWIFICSVLLIGNIYVFLHREQFAYTKQLSYNDLYARSYRLAINEFRHEGKGLLTVLTDSSPISVQLKEGVHRYKFFLAPDSVDMTAEYKSAATNEDEFAAVYFVDHELENQFGVCRRIFTADTALFPAVRKILNDSIFTGAEKTTADKVEKISLFLHKKIFASRGEPTPSTLKLNALEAYHAACRGERIWCGIYTQIFDLFVQSAGVYSKTIEIRQTMPGITGSVHEFNHYYDAESGNWFFTDLMFNVASAETGSGRKLNSVEFKNADWSDTTLSIKTIFGDSIIRRPLNGFDWFMQSLYGREKDLLFYAYSPAEYHNSLWKKVKNYTTKRPWYGIYSDMRIYSNRGFYFKQALLILLGLSFVFLAIVAIQKRKNDRVQ